MYPIKISGRGKDAQLVNFMKCNKNEWNKLKGYFPKLNINEGIAIKSYWVINYVES